MIDGESDGHTWRNISGICDLLKISADGDREVKKYVIQNKKSGNQQFGCGAGISQKNKDQAKMEAYKASNTVCPIEMIGVWDTVGALGIPISFLKNKSGELFNFHDTTLSPEVKYAYHAVATDEKRASFEPTLWQETPETENRIKQVWFPGVHSDVGGGYPERHHSDVALKWMVDQAKKHGLLIKQNYRYEYHIDLKKNIHASAYKLLGVEIDVEERQAPVTPTNVTRVHWSVREKMKQKNDYKPLALINYIDNLDTLAPYTVEQ